MDGGCVDVSIVGKLISLRAEEGVIGELWVAEGVGVFFGGVVVIGIAAVGGELLVGVWVHDYIWSGIVISNLNDGRRVPQSGRPQPPPGVFTRSAPAAPRLRPYFPPALRPLQNRKGGQARALSRPGHAFRAEEEDGVRQRMR